MTVTKIRLKFSWLFHFFYLFYQKLFLIQWWVTSSLAIISDAENLELACFRCTSCFNLYVKHYIQTPCLSMTKAHYACNTLAVTSYWFAASDEADVNIFLRSMNDVAIMLTTRGSKELLNLVRNNPGYDSGICIIMSAFS